MTEAAPVPPDLLQHAAFVRRLARSLLGDVHAAEDVAQETWRASLEHPPGRGGDPRGWLARVLRHFAFRRRRSEARRETRERQVAREEAQAPGHVTLERAETLQVVVDAVRALGEPYRSTVLARYYEDLAPSEIAARDGVSVETVHTRLRRGLARLREQLGRGREDWRAALGLLAGTSPCLPPHAGEWAWPTKHVLVSALAALGVVMLWTAVGSETPRPPVPIAAGAGGFASEVVAAPPAPAGGRESTPPAQRIERVLAGHVRDEQDEPVLGAKIWVLGHQDPFGTGAEGPSARMNHFCGRIFTTDAEGHWRAVLPEPGSLERLDCRDCHAEPPARLPEPEQVFVALGWQELYDDVYEVLDEARWVTPPDSTVDFRVRRLPSATLEVRVLEGAAHRPVETFDVELRGATGRLPDGAVQFEFFANDRAEEGLLRRRLGVPDPLGRRVKVVLTRPELGDLWSRLGLGDAVRPEQEIVLVPGATEEVVFVLPERGVVRGRVVDELGAPVPEALVFFGEETRVRGDEPFKPVRPERVTDGVRTGADGWFELHGDGARVTALHPEHSGATVEVARAGRIELGARGAIRGRVLGLGGRPAADLPLRLDQRGMETRTDAGGRFAFERVEAGAHAVFAERDWPLACVRLVAGEECQLELVRSEPVGLTLELGGLSAHGVAPRVGLLIGRERLFDLRVAEPRGEPNRLSVAERPRPGPYWFVTDAGWCASVELGGSETRVPLELGAGELVVTSSERTSAQLVPADADPFLRLLAARAQVRIEPDSPARFHAPPGSYLLVGEAGAILRAVELPAGGLELALD